MMFQFEGEDIGNIRLFVGFECLQMISPELGNKRVVVRTNGQVRSVNTTYLC